MANNSFSRPDEQALFHGFHLNDTDNRIFLWSHSGKSLNSLKW